MIYANIESLLEKIFPHVITMDKSFMQQKINKHTVCGYSLFTYCSFDRNKNKLDFQRVEDTMKKFWTDLRKHATKIVNCDKKEILPLIMKQEKKSKKTNFCQIWKEKFNDMFDEDENYRKVCDHCDYTGKYRGLTHSICSLKYKVPK